MSDTCDRLYRLEDLARVTGMSSSTLATLLHRSRVNRRNGKVSPNDVPEPDAVYGMAPVWTESTVREWLTVRAESPRVRRAVDPIQSIEQGRAVPLAVTTESAIAEPSMEKESAVTPTLRTKLSSFVKSRRRIPRKEH